MVCPYWLLSSIFKFFVDILFVYPCPLISKWNIVFSLFDKRICVSKFSIIKITYVIIHPPPKTTPYVFFCISFLLSWLKFSLWFILKTFSAAVKIWWYKYSCGLFFNALFQFLTAFFFLLKIFFSSLIFFSFKLIELF